MNKPKFTENGQEYLAELPQGIVRTGRDGVSYADNQFGSGIGGRLELAIIKKGVVYFHGETSQRNLTRPHKLLELEAMLTEDHGQSVQIRAIAALIFEALRSGDYQVGTPPPKFGRFGGDY